MVIFVFFAVASWMTLSGLPLVPALEKLV